MSKKSFFASDLLRVIISKGLVIIIGIANPILTARVLGSENDGYIAALAVYPSLFMTIGLLGIRQSTAYYMGRNIYRDNDIKRAIVQIWFYTSTICVIVCCGLMLYFSESGNNQIWVVLSLMPIPFMLFNTYSSGIFLGKNQIRTFNRINWLPPFVSLLLVLIFVVFLSRGGGVRLFDWFYRRFTSDGNHFVVQKQVCLCLLAER